MTSLALSFNDVNFSPVQNDNQIWLTASELARALGYKQENAVSKIFNRNADEFSEEMTKVVKNPQLPNLGMRIFNSRGCHLIAMFARTNVAKQFRKWVLDVLDKVTAKPTTIAKTHKEEREPLTSAVNLLVAKTKHLNYSEAYKIVHQRFNVDHINEIPYDVLPIAVEYVHHLIALLGKDRKANDTNAIALAHCMIWCRQWWKEYGGSIRKISPTIASNVNDHFVDGASIAWAFVDESEKVSLKKKLDFYEWNLSANGQLKLMN